MSHECPAPGCEADVPRHQLACREHWFSLPKEIRDKVWSAYHKHGMGSPEHGDAINLAMEYLGHG